MAFFYINISRLSLQYQSTFYFSNPYERTGYSSLAYLRKLPVHEIKVDKAFVMEMNVEKNDEMIVRTVINLAHNLGLRVVAEGIECEEVWDTLVALECNIAQGYFLSPPVPAETFNSWYVEHRGTV